ncbi:MAG: SpoIIE family protein phosphatase, partial [Candidatus Microthrix subdominans]
EMAEQLDPLIRSVLSTGEPIADVEVTARPSASPNDELVCSVGYFRIDDGDEPLGIGALVADVTERAHDRRRLEQLAKLTRRMSSAETVDQVATAIVHDGPPVVGADRMVVGQADSQTGVFELLAAEDPTKISSFQPVRGDRPLFDRVLATGETVLVGSRAQRLIEYPSDVEIADAVGVVATATVPLRRPDHSIFGLLTAGWNYEVARDDFPVAQLEVIADLCAQTLGRARAGVDRRALVSSLQTALLSPPPLVKDIEVAVRYVPAIDSLGFGGDWFDVVPIDSRRTALIVGDVVGHNAGAAARMSQLRTVISTLVQTGTSPSELFRRCDEVLDLRNQTTMATVAAVIVDTEAKTLSTVLAGHPPPLLMPRDGPAARLPAGLRPPLGVGADRRDPVTVPYEPGSTLLVYTDGLIESRGGDIDADIEALTARLGRVGRGTPENVAEGLLRVGADRASDGDDIALVVARL